MDSEPLSDELNVVRLLGTSSASASVTRWSPDPLSVLATLVLQRRPTLFNNASENGATSSPKGHEELYRVQVRASSGRQASQPPRLRSSLGQTAQDQMHLAERRFAVLRALPRAQSSVSATESRLAGPAGPSCHLSGPHSQVGEAGRSSLPLAECEEWDHASSRGSNTTRRPH